nr:hypothetical protein [uncultured Merdimonas sp.]
MEWVLFFIFLSTDLLCVLLCRYSFGKADEYKEGMIYGVHIPADQLSDSGVQKICREGKRQWRLFHRINLPLSLLLCLLCLYDFIVFILVWSIWLILYLAGVYYLILAPHRKMYRMKMANGWIRETGRKIVRIDTVVSAASKKMALCWQWHIPVLVLTAASGYLLYLAGHAYDVVTEEMIPFWAMYASSIGICLLFLLFHIGILRRPNKVYSDQTEINLAANRLTRRSWSESLLFAAMFTGASWIYLAYSSYKYGPMMMEVRYGIYTILIILAAISFLTPLIISAKKRHEILLTDPAPLFIDDDEYWKSGWYSNPDDPHILVQDRFNSMNLSFNFAHTGVKVFVGALCAITVAVILWTISLISGFENARIIFTKEGDVFRIEAAGYTCDFTSDDIVSVMLADSLPDEKFIRTNGGSTDHSQIGHFRGKETGKCMMFLKGDTTPILKITLKDMTIFANSPEKETVESWYQELTNES